MPYQPVCKKPWNNVLVGIDGSVRFCCHGSDYKIGIIGNLNENSFEEVWNSSPARRIRRIFLNGGIPRGCVGCPVLKRRDHD